MRLPAEIPIEPDADTARQWVVDELARDAYRNGGRSWLEELMEWIRERLSGLRLPSGDGGIGGVPGAVIGIVLGVLALAAIIYFIVGPIRRSRRRKASHAVFDDDDRSASAIRDAAQAAADAGDWTTAVLERFRALVRRVEEDGWVPVVPGMTAYEFVTDAGALAPALAADLLWAGDTFDGIRYGHEVATPASYERMASVDSRVGTARVVTVTS